MNNLNYSGNAKYDSMRPDSVGKPENKGVVWQN